MKAHDGSRIVCSDDTFIIDRNGEKLDKISWQGVADAALEGIVHRLGNQLTVLVGVAELMSREDDLPPIMQALLNEIPSLETSVDMLKSITVAKGSDNYPQALETDRLVRDAVIVVSAMKDFDGEFILKLAGVPPVSGCAGRLTRELVALLCKAAEGRSVTTVRYAQKEKQLIIIANDNSITLSCL